MLKTHHALVPGRTSRLRPVQPPANRTVAQLSRSLWYALYFPQLSDTHLSDQQKIQQLACLCLQASDHIAIVREDVLVLEIRSSLKYFGGLKYLRQTLRTSLQSQLQQWQLPDNYCDAVSPSASASIVLAGSGISRVVTDPQNLRSVLGRIAVADLALDIKLVRRLEQCGLFYLQNLWRLPAASLRIRFGRGLSDYLEQLLAQRPTVLSRWQPALSFCETLTPDIPAENQQDMIMLAAELLVRMQQFLQKHHLSTDHILFSLQDEKGSVQPVNLGTRRPVREESIWLLLFENSINALRFSRGVISLTLSIIELHAYHPSGANPKERGNMPALTIGSSLLETLCARLGAHSIFCLNQQQDYDPVAAGKYLEYPAASKSSDTKYLLKQRGFGLREQQPCWLLLSPLPLKVQHQSPVYLSPLTFVRGPERIETHWWSGKHIRRDYYIASNQQGMMLWVYRDIGKRSWFLQGLFA